MTKNRRILHRKIAIGRIFSSVSVCLFFIYNFYRQGRIQEFLPPQFHDIGGTSMDFYADAGIPYTYTIELPDLGKHGFQLPESEIEDVRLSLKDLKSF